MRMVFVVMVLGGYKTVGQVRIKENGLASSPLLDKVLCNYVCPVIDL